MATTRVERSSRRGWVRGLALLLVAGSITGCDSLAPIFGFTANDARWIAATILLSGFRPTVVTNGVAIGARARPLASGAVTLDSFTPTAAFRGNQSAIVGGALSAPASFTGSFVVREANCSLTQYSLATAVVAGSAITATLPNAEAHLRRISGLTPGSGTFAKGCSDRARGLASAPGAFLGRAANGDLLAVVVGSTGKLTLLRFSTAGVPVSQTVLVASGATTTLSAIDLNGDGIADIVSPYMSSGGINGVGVLLSRADGTFGPVAIYPVYPAGTAGGRTSIEDVNGDGKLDIVAIGRPAGFAAAPTLATLIGSGNGTFIQGPVSTPSVDNGPFVLADFDGDGRPDLLTASGLLLSGNADGSFGAHVQRLDSFASGQARNLAVGDFNGDGKLDVALRDGKFVTIHTGQGDGTFVPGVSYAPTRGADYLAVSDVDGDGNADIVVGLSSPGVYGPDLRTQSVTQFLLGRGDGTFAAADALSGVGVSRLASAPTFALDQFVADDYPDLVTMSAGAATTLSIYRGSASARFGAPTTVASLGFHPDLLTSGDVDGDGHPDLIAAGARLAVLRGLGGGAFAAEQSYALPGTGDRLDLVNLAAADFNGDGRADVVVIMGRQGALSGGAFVYIANADGSLKPPVQVDAATNLRALAVGDLNGDGRADIAVGGLDPQFYAGANLLRGVRVYRGNADGSFAAPLSLTPGGTIVALAIGDMDQDGKKDLVVGSQDASLNDTVFVFPGMGDGTFGAAKSFVLPGGGPGIVSLAIGDFTFDGKPDVLLGGDAYSAVLVGAGDGTLTGPSALTIAGGAAYVAAIDLDKNGASDAIVAVNAQGLVPLVRTTSVLDAAVSAPTVDFAVALSPVSGIVGSGESTTSTVNLTFTAGFAQTVSFACAGLPANATCTFSPATVTPSSATATTIRIDTAVASAAAQAGDGDSPWTAVALSSIVLAVVARSRPRGKSRRGLSLLLAGSLGVLALSSCGGGDGSVGGIVVPMPTPSGSYPLTISATAGAVTKTAVYTLTVR